MAGKRSIKKPRQPREPEYLSKDVEDRPPEDRKYRFRDNRKLDPDDQRRLEFKELLLSSVESSNGLEDYRKSDDEVGLHCSPSPRIALTIIFTAEENF
jgi:hypothetical protein